jgi:hypothetical protein
MTVQHTAFGWSMREQAKWLGVVEGQLDYLAGLLFMAYPEGSEEHRKPRWAVIRLRVLFGKLRAALILPPMRP